MTATMQRRPALQDAAAIVTFGNLAWVAWVWLTVSVVYAAILAAIVRWGEIDESLWQSVAAVWQRWLLFAAGVSTMVVILRMLVRNGATRGLVSSASTVAMASLAALGTLFIMAGFAVEHVVYERYGWPQRLRGESLFEWSDLGRLAIESTLALATYSVCGSLVGVCFSRFGWKLGLLLIVPCLVPAALTELVTTKDFGGVDIEVLPEWGDRPPLLLAAVAGLAIVAVTVAVARRVTREMAVR